MEIKAAPVDTSESDDAVEADLDAEEVIADPEIAESEESPEGIQDVSLEETGKEMSDVGTSSNRFNRRRSSGSRC